jgi:glycosyltransferase involved in cell wall biosynthesis
MGDKLRILIDATCVAKVKAGVGIYAKNLIENLMTILEAADGRWELFVLAQDDDKELDFSHRRFVTMLWVPSAAFRIFGLRLILEQLYLPYLLTRLRVDVVHSLHYAFPLLPTRARRVVTIHDMTFFIMPEVHERIKVIYFRFFLRAVIHLPIDVIFVSKSAQADFLAKLSQPPGRTFVIAHGKDKNLLPLASSAKSCRLREKYGLPERFVLYIGTIEPRKNLHRLVAAFAAVAAEDAEIGLVIVGKMGWMMDSLSRTVEQWGLLSRTIFTGFIPEEEKPSFFAACEIFVYPSLYEGFGLPVLEAMACGTPTITSNISSLPEVAGDAAVLIDPRNVDELAAAIRALLADQPMRQELRRRGIERSKQFTWENTASRTANIYLTPQPDRARSTDL